MTVKRFAIFLIILTIIFVINCDNDLPTENIIEIGGAEGSVSFYADEPLNTYALYALLTKTIYESMPTSQNAFNFMGDNIFAKAPLQEDYSYSFEDVHVGRYFLSVGPVIESHQVNNYSTRYPFMSYHSASQIVEITKGGVAQIQEIMLYPGGIDFLDWDKMSPSDGHQGFNFTLRDHIMLFENADIWFDGENNCLIVHENSILGISPERQGLLYITDVPDSGFTSEVKLLGRDSDEGTNIFIVKTKQDTYVKMRIFTADAQREDSIVTKRGIWFEWYHQADSQTVFSY